MKTRVVPGCWSDYSLIEPDVTTLIEMFSSTSTEQLERMHKAIEVELRERDMALNPKNYLDSGEHGDNNLMGC